MMALHHQTPILLATQPVDFRKGIDGFVALCRDVLQQTPNNGHYFVFISRDYSRLRVLTYDGTGYWLMTKRLSRGRFNGWPKDKTAVTPLLAKQLQQLVAGKKLDECQYVAA